MTPTITQADVLLQFDMLQAELADAGVLPDGTRLGLDRSSGTWRLSSTARLPGWLNTHLGSTKRETLDALWANRYAVHAFTDGARRVAGLTGAPAHEVWKTLVAEGMEPVPAVQTANALAQ